MIKLPKPPKQSIKRCKVVTDKGYLFLTMPDGTIIPHQTKMTLENNTGNEDISMVTITVMADTKYIKNLPEFKIDSPELINALKKTYEQNNT